jgi:hypothetical protein
MKKNNALPLLYDNLQITFNTIAIDEVSSAMFIISLFIPYE